MGLYEDHSLPWSKQCKRRYAHTHILTQELQDVIEERGKEAFMEALKSFFE
jgi:hypothetical protein